MQQKQQETIKKHARKVARIQAKKHEAKLAMDQGRKYPLTNETKYERKAARNHACKVQGNQEKLTQEKDHGNMQKNIIQLARIEARLYARKEERNKGKKLRGLMQESIGGKQKGTRPERQNRTMQEN